MKPSYQSLFYCCVARDHPLAHQEWVSWQDLKQASLVLQDYASGSRPLIDAALAHFAIEADIVQEIGHPATLFSHGGGGNRHQCAARAGVTAPAGQPLAG